MVEGENDEGGGNCDNNDVDAKNGGSGGSRAAGHNNDDAKNGGSGGSRAASHSINEGGQQPTAASTTATTTEATSSPSPSPWSPKRFLFRGVAAVNPLRIRMNKKINKARQRGATEAASEDGSDGDDDGGPRLDPRYQILEYFDSLPDVVGSIGDNDGDGGDDCGSGAATAVSTATNAAAATKASTEAESRRPSVFTVWRPTSAIAIERMMRAEATGKGLEIKGKSSKAGSLSGFVPYLQIHLGEHKNKVATLHRNGRTRIFFPSEAARDDVLKELEPLRQHLIDVVHEAKRAVAKTAVSAFIQPMEKTAMLAKTQARSIGQSHLVSDLAASSRAVTGAADGALSHLVKSTESGIGSVSKNLRTSTESGIGSVSKNLRTSTGAVTSGLKNSLVGRSARNAGDAVVGAASSSFEKTSAVIAEVNHGTVAASSRLRESLRRAVSRINSEKKKSRAFENDEREWALRRLLWDMDDPSIRKIDDYAAARHSCYGIELPDRMLWKAFVVDKDISRPEGSKYYTVRPSEPAFQDMNFNAIYKTRKNKGDKKSGGDPRVVLWQTSCGVDGECDPMDPRGLIMAYEEHGRVLPVVSDFDCFTMGTRGFRYDVSLPEEQKELLKWSVDQIEDILDEMKPDLSKSWTACWLKVLKASASAGFRPSMPRYGFGDTMSYSIVEHAVRQLSSTGAVRHGAECFNYYFPQELDDEFLIVAGGLPNGAKWQYVGVDDLQKFLMQKIEEGYVFPLNPKWVLCDPGWKAIFDRLNASDSSDVQRALNVWYPEESGIRDRIESIFKTHPAGFVSKRDPNACGTEAMDLAQLELDRFVTFERARIKLRAVVAFNSLLEYVRRRNATRSLRRWFSGQRQRGELPRILLLDGGVSTNLEEKVGSFSVRELWSSSLLLTESGRSTIYEGHFDWIEAGCDVISTVTYQCHYEANLWPSTEEVGNNADIVTSEVIDQAWKDGIGLARRAGEESFGTNARRVFVLASSGCYGAALANGAEYTGDYGDISVEQLAEFHRRKFESAMRCKPDAIAFETVPSLKECEALRRLLESDAARDALGDLHSCYVSLACRGDSELNDGTPVKQALDVLLSVPSRRLHGIGFNCCDSRHLQGLLSTLLEELSRRQERRAIVAYPNSGEQWDAETESWVTGTGVTASSEMASTLMGVVRHVELQWSELRSDSGEETNLAFPSILVGGCCRTTPQAIAELRSHLNKHLADEFAS